MKTIAERIKNDRLADFEANFDKGTFLGYVEEQIRKFGHIEIGIVYDSWILDIKKDYKQVKQTDCDWLSFGKDYKCYIWRTDCQIPQKFVSFVMDELAKQGLQTYCKGACGYDEYDLIVAKL